MERRIHETTLVQKHSATERQEYYGTFVAYTISTMETVMQQM